jgi:predicted nucleic acid-binding protein
MSLVVDASVAIKWYAEEPGSDAAATLLARDDLTAPDLIFAEVGNAFWKRIRRNASHRVQAEAGLARLSQDLARTVPLAELAAASLRLSIDHDHPVYDCCYVALAQREDAGLATADIRLAKLARSIRLSVEFFGE